MTFDHYSAVLTVEEAEESQEAQVGLPSAAM